MPALDYAFFGPNDALYGIAGGPPDARRAVLVVSPPGVDAVRARRVLFRLVRALAAAGHGALLVDPRGSGESALAFEETSLETHVADVRDGLHELARRFPEAHQRLIAVRYGAVPALAAVEPPAADALLLIDPCLDVRAALRQDLRGEIAKRMRRGGTEATATIATRWSPRSTPAGPSCSTASVSRRRSGAASTRRTPRPCWPPGATAPPCCAAVARRSCRSTASSRRRA